MNKLFFMALTLVFTVKTFAQISPADSTVQVVAFWANKDTQNYSISEEKYKVKGTDTTAREMVNYDVVVTIKDSTAKSYTVEWLYKNFNVKSDNEFTKGLMALSQNMSVIFKTDEMGAFVEVVNWKEVKDYIIKSTNTLKKEYKDVPKIDDIITQIQGMFSTKDGIESLAIKDIHQFYTYHGGKYKLGEDNTGKVKLPNHLGGPPFDADLVVKLDEINFTDENAIFRMTQTVDSKQLTDATFDYMKKPTASIGGKQLKRNDLPAMQNITSTASRIHGPSGWIIYSIETKEVSSENFLNVDERIIELK